MKNILYFLPFLFFIAGYTALSWLTQVNSVVVPQLVGMPLADAIKTLSELQLNVRIVGLQEETDVPAGTVMSHVPAAGSALKTHQRVFMIISKNPELLKAPQCVGMLVDQADLLAHQNGIRLKKFFITSATHPKNTIIAQSPSEGQPLPDKTILLYCSKGEDSIVLIPDFRGLSASFVESFCARNEFPLEVGYVSSHDSLYSYDACVVKHQRPLAGSLVDMHKGLKFQISIEKV